MADFNLSTPAGQAAERNLMILYINTGTADAPVWSAVGHRVEESSIELDWSVERGTDILGINFSKGKKSTRTQTFNTYPLDAGDAAAAHIWQLGIVDDNVNALLNQDCLIAHFYAENSSANFAERYPASAVLPTSLGGEGGGNLVTSLEVTYGGERSVGTVTRTGSTVKFTPSVTV